MISFGAAQKLQDTLSLSFESDEVKKECYDIINRFSTDIRINYVTVELTQLFIPQQHITRSDLQKLYIWYNNNLSVHTGTRWVPLYNLNIRM